MTQKTEQNIDISDLLVEDTRLPYNWRSAEVRRVQNVSELIVLFPDSSYSIDVDKSELRNNGTEWALHVKINYVYVIQMIEKIELNIPQGVEKIVWGKVEEIGYRRLN